LYFTIGTGIGAGAMLNGQLVHGIMHTEIGHILIPHDRTRDPFPGVCPNHGDCFEGLASGPAIKERWSVRSAMDLPPDHPAWILEAEYLSCAMANAILCFSPERIVLGGGVMKQTQLLPQIHRRTVELLAGYIESESIAHIEKTIVLASKNAGPRGVLALALRFCY
jgi:fructokinase